MFILDCPDVEVHYYSCPVIFLATESSDSSLSIPFKRRVSADHLAHAMGETYIKVKVHALPSGPASEELKLLVDTGAAYSWLPRHLLEKLGAKPTRKARFKTIKGEIIVRDVGHVFAEHEEEVAPMTTVFAEESDASVFGLHGLESLGLEVDPTSKQVRKSEALLAL